MRGTEQMPILDKETSVFPASLFDEAQYALGMSDRQWWAIFTKSRHEKAVARDLERCQIPFFLPLVPRPNQIRNRLFEAYIPLFNCYVFMFGSDEERLRRSPPIASRPCWMCPINGSSMRT